MAGSKETGEAVEAWGEVVTIAWFRGGGMQRHPNGKRTVDLRPGLGQQRACCASSAAATASGAVGKAA